ncbi:hypothetical protein FFLO_02166 [Filobasidium floriforme]|uniref:Uncharacterized protein n=1 Tax=Filobasidium floriforme TaxID=5210 RepID=A0A8K0JNG1_9TREE|nr:uncharacterized protein HD553DRAFT_306450 [Filobasidium floriforme]KAG7562386.1 hypothetical protein FFLO_02166 [Filobasidium floriforme]KAH8088441.1 hypothetical protein HD553DRAFT_306450 [Filobasidium floriforme]
MEATKPVVQVILPRSDATEDGQELSRPPSVFPVAEVDRLRAQEGESGSGQGTIQNEPSVSSTLIQTERDGSRDHAPAPPQYDDPIPYHPKPSLDLPPYEPLPDTFQPRTEKPTPKSNLSLAASASATASASDEKRRLDLEAVTTAVDQAYAATPQFDDQRSELRPSGSRSASTGVGFGVGKIRGEGTAMGRKMSLKDEKELNKLFDQIERAHGHKLPDQSTELDTERAAERNTKKRESFYQDLLTSTSAGRMRDQEYDLSNASPRVSPLVKSFTESGSGFEPDEHEREEGDRKRKSREVVDIHQAIRDGPGQL